MISCIKDAPKIVLLLLGLVDKRCYHLLRHSVFSGNLSLLLKLDEHPVDNVHSIVDGEWTAFP